MDTVNANQTHTPQQPQPMQTPRAPKPQAPNPMKRLLTNTLIFVIEALCFTIIALFAESEYLSHYCFATVMVTALALSLTEIIQQRNIHHFQYLLIGSALCLFPFLFEGIDQAINTYARSGIIATLMTVGLITTFIHGIFRKVSVTILTGILLALEYGLVFLLYHSLSQLLVGSLTAFILIAAAMYFSLKINNTNSENSNQ